MMINHVSNGFIPVVTYHDDEFSNIPQSLVALMQTFLSPRESAFNPPQTHVENCAFWLC